MKVEPPAHHGPLQLGVKSDHVVSAAAMLFRKRIAIPELLYSSPLQSLAYTVLVSLRFVTPLCGHADTDQTAQACSSQLCRRMLRYFPTTSTLHRCQPPIVPQGSPGSPSLLSPPSLPWSPAARGVRQDVKRNRSLWVEPSSSRVKCGGTSGAAMRLKKGAA